MVHFLIDYALCSALNALEKYGNECIELLRKSTTGDRCKKFEDLGNAWKSTAGVIMNTVVLLDHYQRVVTG